MKKLLTVNQAADMLGVKAATIYEWLNKGKLKGVKLASSTWRTTDDDIEDFVNTWRN